MVKYDLDKVPFDAFLNRTRGKVSSLKFAEGISPIDQGIGDGFSPKDTNQSFGLENYGKGLNPLEGETDSDTFLVSKTFDTVTPESAEDGDTSDNGFVFQDEVMDRSDVVRELRNGGFTEPSSSSLASLRWVTSEGEQDYTNGSSTSYSLHIKDMTGSEISGETWKSLLGEAGLLAYMHFSKIKKAGIFEDEDEVNSYPPVDSAEDSAFEEPTECPMCGGPSGVLGVLGNTVWLSCRNCGQEFPSPEETEAHVGSSKAADATEPSMGEPTSSHGEDASEAPNTATAKLDHPEAAVQAKMIKNTIANKTTFDPNQFETD